MSWSKRQSPSVTMSSPATSCSRRYTERASTYCSRKGELTIASRNERRWRLSVYQVGRGSEPVTVVGRIFPSVALSMAPPLRSRQLTPHPLELAADVVDDVPGLDLVREHVPRVGLDLELPRERG